MKRGPSILVVDDDDLIRRGLADLARAALPDAREVRQAEDGLKAVREAAAAGVDIVVTDVKMPGCDGIEMIGRLAGLGFRGQIVVVSGFDDYALVRSALKAGAVDYLLKPVDPAEFAQVLRACRDRLESGASAAPEPGRLGTPLENLFRDQVVLDALLAGRPRDSAVAAYLEAAGLSGDEDALLAAVAVDEAERRDEAARLDRYRAYAEAAAAGNRLDGYALLQGEAAGRWIVLLVRRRGKAAPDTVALRLKLEGGGRKFAFASAAYPLPRADAALRDCGARLDELFYNLPAQRPAEGAETDPAALLESMAEAACAYDAAGFANGAYALFALYAAERTPPAEVKKALGDFLHRAMLRNNAFINVVSRHKFTDADLMRRIDEADSASALRADFVGIMRRYVELAAAGGGAGDEDALIAKAKAVIRRRCAGRLTLADVAAELDMHPNYFCTVFKARAGVGFLTFLRDARIEKAVALMKDTNLRLYQIAEAAGFKDDAHFCRSFKAATGRSPAAYRRTLLP